MIEDLRGAPSAPALVGRRQVLRSAGAAALGAVAGIAGASSPAAAATGDPVVAGQSNTASAVTTLTVGGASPGFRGVADEGVALRGESLTGIGIAASSGSGTALTASSENGRGVVVTCEDTALELRSQNGSTLIMAAGGDGAATFPFAVGQLDGYADGELWWTTESSAIAAPTLWRRLAGPKTAGAMHVLAGSLASMTRDPARHPRTSGRRPSSHRTPTASSAAASTWGAAPSPVPSWNASVVFVNVTAVNTAGSGRIGLFHPDQGFGGASMVNWQGAGAVVANGALVPCRANTQIGIRSTVATDVVVQVQGYFR